MQTCSYCSTCTPDGYVCDCQDSKFAEDMAAIAECGWEASPDDAESRRLKCARIWYKRDPEAVHCACNNRPPSIQLRLWDYRYCGHGWRYEVRFAAQLQHADEWCEFMVYSVNTVDRIEPSVRTLMKAWAAVNTPE